MTISGIRKALVGAALLPFLLPIVAVRAQGPPPWMDGGASSIDVKKFNAEKELTRLTKKYKLTEDERTKIQPILADQEKRVHDLGDDDSLSDREWAAAVRKVHQETVLSVKAQMTDDHATKYVKDEEKQAKSDEEDQQGPGGGPGGGGPPPGGGPPGE
jgi:Spy/CpxP family protein refolding chaperone